MKLKLNFVLGQRTVNGRFYEPEMMKQQFHELFSKNEKIPVGPDSDCIDDQTGKVPDDKIVGYATTYNINEDGTVEFEVTELSEATESYLTNNPDQIKMTIFGFGGIDNNKNIQTFNLTSLFMTMDG